MILHGGEPLLAGIPRLRRVCEELTTALAGVAGLDLRIHTNGVQLSSRHLDLFDEYDVKVGISLDGDKAANDRHRRFADGRTSHPLVLGAVELLSQERFRHLYLGLLCTIDVANDPAAVLDALTALDPPRIDFLLPHATWEAPPARPDGSPTAYADWILAVFDRWERQGRPVPVRLFASVLSTLGGGPSLTESLGLAPTDLVVVETDGTLEQVDSLKSAYDGAASTGFDVFRHSFDEVAAHPGVRARQLGLAGVSEQCRRCPVVRSCGGGLYTHRYAPESGFDNPSVYCADLKALILGIEARTAARTASPAVRDPAEQAAGQDELTRTLLARLHADLDGRGGEAWDEAWELAGTIEQRSDGLGSLDEVLAHPYARSWLLDTLDALREERPGAAGAAGFLSAYTAAAAVRGGLDLTVRAGWRDGTLSLPTLGSLVLGGPGEHGSAEVRPAEDGFVVRVDGVERRIVCPGEPAPGWWPVRRLGVTGLVLDDVDPYRDCFPTPAHPRLEPAEAAAWSRLLAEAWALLRAAVPGHANRAVAALTTFTPLASGEPSAGRHGYGALGVPVLAGGRMLAPALLRGFRRAELRALCEVADLYALDGDWLHPAPWQGEPVPVSGLLVGAYERVALAAYWRADEATAELAVRALAESRRALEALEQAAELTVSGKSLLAVLWGEWEGAAAGERG
ncbi:hypothetical protein GCM10020367_12550 [Streptomyces sannanensis]|uniref:FxsB family radical SAM/SPASM domain protein n=1 Tax=Streptomyces sannanensis TaxID=285536 RepID=A0ABP6S757_9ACTN